MLIWVMAMVMVDGGAGTIPGIVLTGVIYIGIVPIIVGVGEVGIVVGTTHGIMVVGMEAIMVVTMVVITAVIILITTYIVDLTI